jgi:predicted HicB family RNase H-like nuclease
MGEPTAVRRYCDATKTAVWLDVMSWCCHDGVMELTPYLEALRRELASAAAPGGPEISRAAELLTSSLEASTRLLLLEALSDAAAEITTKLTDSSVEVRLRGREAQFVVTEQQQPAPAAAPTAPTGTEGDLARITLRLPEGLKEQVERAAAAEGISVNAWLVRAIASMVHGPQFPFGAPGPGPNFPPNPPGRRGRRLSGYAEA